MRDRHGPPRHAHRNRHLWPSGIAGRLTLLIAGILIVALWTSAALYIRDRADTTFRLFTESVSDRIAHIVPLIERTPPDQRDDLLRALNSPTLWMAVTPGPRPHFPRGWRRDPRLGHSIRGMLPDLHGRRILIRVYDESEGRRGPALPLPGEWTGPRMPGEHAERGEHADREEHAERGEHARPRARAVRPAPPDLLDSRVKVLIAVGLTGGEWLQFIASTDTTSLHWATRVALWLGLATVLFIVLAFWTVHRMTRPLRRFAEAAERIGLDVRSPPLPERGSRELRNATRAFNEMQSRLRRFVDDRTMMLAAISHDLRTMLTRLKLRAEFIDDAEQQQKAISDLDEMQAMLDSTLAFARDDAADEPRVQTDLAALVRSLCDDMADAGQKVVCDGPDRLPYPCAPGAIRRAVQNVVVNAVKYGTEASVTVADGPDGVEIAVADRGPGVPPDRREDVFRPFLRLETSRNRETGGTGLGLAVARSIIRRHGGDIALEDRDGGGLIVRILLPHTPIGGAHGRPAGATGE